MNGTFNTLTVSAQVFFGDELKSGADAYRYGFGGQEKDNEIYGEGKSYTAEFWQYDSRLGRRWNVDQVRNPWISSYAPFSNNPIIFIDPDGNNPIDPRTGQSVTLNLNRAAVYDISSAKIKKVRDDDLHNRADGFLPRRRGEPDGAWSGAKSFPPTSVWERTSTGAMNALKKIFPNKESVVSDYGSPNDGAWRNAADMGSYTYVDDKYSVSEIFRIGQKSFNIVSVDENYITQSVNLTRTDKSGKYNINSVTTFDIEKGDVQYRNVKTWWGGTRTEKYRELKVTETTQYYENNQPTDRKEVKSYTREERVK